MTTAFVHTFERSNVCTEVLSEAEFNGVGGLQAHIGVNGIPYAAMPR
jgi:hypothetical protein